MPNIHSELSGLRERLNKVRHRQFDASREAEVAALVKERAVAAARVAEARADIERAAALRGR